jgi:hypothetical protein
MKTIKYTDVLKMIHNKEFFFSTRLEEVNESDARKVIIVSSEGTARVSLICTHTKSNLRFLVGVFFHYSYASPYSFTDSNGHTIVAHSGLETFLIESPVSISIFGDRNTIDNEHDLAVELMKLRPVADMIFNVVFCKLKWYKATIKEIELKNDYLGFNDNYSEFFDITFELLDSREIYKKKVIFKHLTRELETGRQTLSLLTYLMGLHGVNQHEFPKLLKYKILYIQIYKGSVVNFAKD